jgi:hypothetical protein
VSLEFTTKRKRLGHDDIVFVFVFVSRFLDGLKVMEPGGAMEGWSDGAMAVPPSLRLR